MKRVLSILLCCFLLISSVSLFGCKDNSATATKVLRICNCEDYIDEDLLEEFKAETGIEVQYSTYGTNENLYNELVINPNSYDLVVPSEYMIQKLAAEGRINKLDLSKVNEYSPSQFIKDKLDGIIFTVTSGEYSEQQASLSEYMVGYMWGTMGWVYNTENVKEEEVSSWGKVFENKQLTQRITVKDSVRDTYLVALAMVYEKELIDAKGDNEKITEILNRVDQTSIDLVGEKINSIKPMLYGFEVDSGKNDIVLGNIDAYVAWSGDAAYAIDVANGATEDEDGSFVKNTKSLGYSIPEEGSNIWFDGFVMPSGSDNYEAVYKFLNFISRPENVIRNMNYTGYTSMVASEQIFDDVVVDWFDESEELDEGEGVTVDLSYFFGEGDYSITVSKSNYGRVMAQYPTKEIADRCAVMNYFDNDTLMRINEMWEGVKGETFPLWLILLVAGLVVVLAVFVVMYRNKERFPWLKFPERKKTYAERKELTVIKKEEV